MPRVDTAILAAAVFLTCLVVNLTRYPAAIPPYGATGQPEQEAATSGGQAPTCDPAENEGKRDTLFRFGPPPPAQPATVTLDLGRSGTPQSFPNSDGLRTDTPGQIAASREDAYRTTPSTGTVISPNSLTSGGVSSIAMERKDSPSTTDRNVHSKSPERSSLGKVSDDRSEAQLSGGSNPPRSRPANIQSTDQLSEQSSQSPPQRNTEAHSSRDEPAHRGQGITPTCDPETGFCTIALLRQDDGKLPPQRGDRASPNSTSGLQPSGSASADDFPRDYAPSDNRGLPAEDPNSPAPRTLFSSSSKNFATDTLVSNSPPGHKAVEEVPLVPVDTSHQPISGIPPSGGTPSPGATGRASSFGFVLPSGRSRSESTTSTGSNVAGAPSDNPSAASRSDEPLLGSQLKNVRRLPPPSEGEVPPSSPALPNLVSGIPFYPATGTD